MPLTFWKSPDPYLRPLPNYLSNFLIFLFPLYVFSFLLKFLQCSCGHCCQVTLLGLSQLSQDNQLMTYCFNLRVKSFLKLLSFCSFNKVLIASDQLFLLSNVCEQSKTSTDCQSSYFIMQIAFLHDYDSFSIHENIYYIQHLSTL